MVIDAGHSVELIAEAIQGEARVVEQKVATQVIRTLERRDSLLNISRVHAVVPRDALSSMSA